MADIHSTESVEQAATRRGKHAWPHSLMAAAAVDDLARQCYEQRMHYYGFVPRKWEDVPYNLRSGYFELAKRLLDGLQTPPSARTDKDDSLFNFATSVARAEAARVTEETPRSVVTGLTGKVISMVCAADVIAGRD